MGETYRRYRHIWQTLKTMYPEEPRGHVACRLNTRVAFICGIIGSRQTRLPAIAGEIPRACQENSQIQKLKRWLINEHVDAGMYFLPFLRLVLASLAHQTRVLVIDGSVVGWGCVTFHSK